MMSWGDWGDNNSQPQNQPQPEPEPVQPAYQSPTGALGGSLEGVGQPQPQPQPLTQDQNQQLMAFGQAQSALNQTPALLKQIDDYNRAQQPQMIQDLTAPGANPSNGLLERGLRGVTDFIGSQSILGVGPGLSLASQGLNAIGINSPDLGTIGGVYQAQNQGMQQYAKALNQIPGYSDLPALAQAGFQTLPYALLPGGPGGAVGRLATAFGSGVAGYGASQGAGALGAGPVTQQTAGLLAGLGTYQGAGVLSRLNPVPELQRTAPEMANPTPLTPSPAGGAINPEPLGSILSRSAEVNTGYLRSVAADRGIDLSGTTSKADVIARLEAANARPEVPMTSGIYPPASQFISPEHQSGYNQGLMDLRPTTEGGNGLGEWRGSLTRGPDDSDFQMGEREARAPGGPMQPGELVNAPYAANQSGLYPSTQAGGGQPQPEGGSAQVPSLTPPPATALSPDEISRLESRQLVSRDIANGAAKLEFKQVPDGTIDVTFRGEPGLSGFREMGVHIDAVRQAFPDTPLTVEATDARRTGAYQRMGFEPSDRYVVPGAQPILEMKPLSQTGSTAIERLDIPGLAGGSNREWSDLASKVGLEPHIDDYGNVSQASRREIQQAAIVQNRQETPLPASLSAQERYTPEQQAANQAQAISRGYMPAPGQTSGEAAAFRDSQNGIQMGAQRAIANGEPGQMPAGAQPTTAGGSGLPSPASSGHGGAGMPPRQTTITPSGALPGGVDWNPIHNLMSAIGAPTQPLLTGLHLARFAPQQMLHPEVLGNGLEAMGEAALKGRAPEISAHINNDFGPNVAPEFRPEAYKAAAGNPRLDPTAVQWMISHTPVVGPILDRFRAVNSALLGNMRDAHYLAEADKVARTDPGASKGVYDNLWREANNSTGHQTLIGNPDALNVSQGMGVGWSAALARVQELGNLVVGTGAPLPWAAGSRGAAFRSMMGVAGTMVGATALGKVLGANVNLTQPFNTFGLESTFAKPVTNNGLYKTVYGTGGAGYDTLFKAAANIGNDLFNSDEKAALNHALAFARGEFGVVPSGVIDGILGQKWNGQPYQWQDFLNEAKTGFMADEKGEFGAGRSVPIAAGENYQAVKAYGPEGLLRALPADIASSVQTTPINTGSQAFKYAAPPDIIQKAYPESPLLQDALKGKDWNELLPNEKKQVTNTLGQSNPELAKQIQDQSRTQNPASAAHGDVITALQDRKTGAENYLLDLYNSGKMDKPTLRGAFHTVENDYYNSKSKADADPAYQAELAKFKSSGTDPSQAQQYVDAYYQISQHFADNKVERQAQEAKYIQWVNSQDPQMAVRLVAAIQPKNQTELEKMYYGGALSGR